MSQSKKILLIEPPYLDLYGKNAAVNPYFPLGLGYIAAFLKKAGHNVKLLLNTGQPDFVGVVMGQAAAFLPDLIGLSAMTPNYPEAIKIARRLKKTFQTPIVIGGQHVSVYKENILTEVPWFDFVVYGEGESTVLELVAAIEAKQTDYSSIKGLAWRQNGLAMIAPPRLLETDMDTIPFPARELADMDLFSTHGHIGGGKSATLITSRGCPHLCTFCSAHNVDGRKYREHSVSYVISEIKLLKEKYGVRYVFMQDDTFTLKRERVENICNALITENLDISFGCFSRVDIMDFEMASLLKKAGCRNVVFGLESGDETILRKIKKKVSAERARQAIDACNRVGLKSTASFIIGFPFDTRETIKQTIQYAFDLKPTLVVFNPLVPFPGSEMFDDRVHKPENPEGWKKYITVGAPPFSFVAGMTPGEIYEIAQAAHRRFYFRPTQLLRIFRTVRDFSEMMEYVRSAFYLLRGWTHV